jgi:hypothetical protein
MTRDLTLDSRSPDRDLKPEPPPYEALLLITLQRRYANYNKSIYLHIHEDIVVFN